MSKAVQRTLRPGECWAVGFLKVLESHHPESEFPSAVRKAVDLFTDIFGSPPAVGIVGTSLQPLADSCLEELTQIIPTWDNTQSLYGAQIYFAMEPAPVHSSTPTSRETTQHTLEAARMGVPTSWTEQCPACGYGHRVALQDCSRCKGKSGQKVIRPISESVENCCKRRKEYVCTECHDQLAEVEAEAAHARRWRQFCSACGHAHTVSLQPCPECSGRSAQDVPQPTSAVVREQCSADYACDGCLTYREHLK